MYWLGMEEDGGMHYNVSRMKHTFSKDVVIALGGSIVYPEQIDSAFIKKFRGLVLRFLKKGYKFVIVAGGGRAARLFQEAAQAVVPVTDEDRDWLGIHATRLNAHLLRTVFREVADPVVWDERHKRKTLKYPVSIASGWEPGWSTDYIAVALAADLGVKEMIVAGKPDHVYDKDPHKYKGAKPFTELSWKQYRKLIPAKWKPGSHSPVDPVAARLAEERGKEAIIVDGRDLKNFERMLKGEEFTGTIIR